MKFLSYAAAVALFTASAAFAQTGPGASANQPGQSNPPAAAGDQPSTGLSNPNPSAGSSSMAPSSSMHHARKATHHSSTGSSAKRTNVSGRDNARENQTTQQLNQGQLNGGGTSSNGGMNPSMNSAGMRSPGMGAQGYSGNPTGNPFDNGRPQAAQAGGASCSPDNPSCGQARRNPGINSSPQHRLEPNSASPTSEQ